MTLAYDDFRRLLLEEPLPAAIIDLDAVDHNMDVIDEQLGDSPVRVRMASKSIRHPWLLQYLLKRGGERYQGLMTFSAHETCALAESGFDNLLIAYPFVGSDEANAVAAWSS